MDDNLDTSLLTVVAVAATFALYLRNEVDAHQWHQIVNQLGSTEDSSCISHDFCDANIPMMEAYEQVTKDSYFPMHDKATGICNDAWTLCRANNFFNGELLWG